MRAVADSGPLIHLSWIDRLDILSHLFDEVVAPPVVRDETLALPGARGFQRLHDLFVSGRVRVVPAARQPADVFGAESQLDAGEAHALLLAEELNANFLLTDDAEALKAAKLRRTEAFGTVTLLLIARDQGLIPAALPLVLELREMGQWLSDWMVDFVRDEDEAPR